jgi:hypothetical protein
LHGAYCVVRYVPSLERGDSINIGLILVSFENGRLVSQFGNLIDFSNYPSHLRPPRELVELAKSYVKDLRKRTKGVDPMALLSGIHHDLLNNIQISEPRPCEFNDLNRFFHSLYREAFVGAPFGHAHRRAFRHR